MKFFKLKTSSQLSLNEQMNFSLKPQSSLIFTLITSIELDKNIDIDLYLLINDNNKLYHVGSIDITIDDLINPNIDRILKLNSFENEQTFIYLNTLSRLDLHIESTSKLHFHQLLTTIGFDQIPNLSNVFIRISEGTIFEHILIDLTNNDDFIVHFYAK
jgi:hypothetical protein